MTLVDGYTIEEMNKRYSRAGFVGKHGVKMHAIDPVLHITACGQQSAYGNRPRFIKVGGEELDTVKCRNCLKTLASKPETIEQANARGVDDSYLSRIPSPPDQRDLEKAYMDGYDGYNAYWEDEPDHDS